MWSYFRHGAHISIPDDRDMQRLFHLANGLPACPTAVSLLAGASVHCYHRTAMILDDFSHF